MLTSPSKQTVLPRPKKNATIKNTNKADLSIEINIDSSGTHQPEPKLSVPQIFTISFNYLEQIFHTKVMAVNYGDGQTIYKTVLGSKLNKSAAVCWLAKQPQGWVLQLGNDIELTLLKAITSAIEYQKSVINKL
jgi:hypothetical protein